MEKKRPLGSEARRERSVSLDVCRVHRDSLKVKQFSLRSASNCFAPNLESFLRLSLSLSFVF